MRALAPGDRSADLADAHAACARLARRHYENFPVGSWLLPRRLRPTVHAVYAFARGADDLADEPEHAAERLRALERWEAMLEDAAAGRARHPVFVALADAMRRHHLPLAPFRDLLAAFRMDARATRFETWEELLGYCRLSANPVGRILLRLFGHADQELDALSDSLCTALQLTNFWQDLGVDLPRGRVYLPGRELKLRGVSEADLRRERVTGALRALLADLIGRTRSLYARARPLPDRLRPPLSWEVRAIAAGGRRVLDALEKDGLDPIARRPKLGRIERAWILCQALAPRWRGWRA